MLLWNWFFKRATDDISDKGVDNINDAIADFEIYRPDLTDDAGIENLNEAMNDINISNSDSSDKENYHSESFHSVTEEFGESKPPVKYKFDPTVQEFADAKTYLENKPDGAKFAKKDTLRKYSFIKSGDKVIAMSNKACFEYKGGAFGIFKIGKTEDGLLVGIKIEPRKLRSPNDPGFIAAVRMGLTYSQAQRSEPGMRFQTLSKIAKGEPKKIVEDKLYTIMRLGETDLFALFNSEFQNKVNITELQKELLRLKIAYQLMLAHSCGIVHRDLKPENIVVTMKDNYIEVGLIDLDGAAVLAPGEQEEIAQDITTTFEYIAPEIARDLIYSAASDVYALGIMFLLDFNIKPIGQNVSHKLDGVLREECYDYLIQQLGSINVSQFISQFNLSETLHLDLIMKMIAQNREERITSKEVVISLCDNLLMNNDVKKDFKLVLEISQMKREATDLVAVKSSQIDYAPKV